MYFYNEENKTVISQQYEKTEQNNSNQFLCQPSRDH